MQRFALFSIMTLALSGCNYTIYHQAGKSFAERDQDILACEVEALAKAPVANQIRYSAPERAERQICDDADNCITEVYWTEPVPFEVDVNEDLRARVTQQCMITKGYQQVELPTCDSGQTYSVPAQMTSLGPNACLVRIKGGSFHIANPG